jgi:3-methyladenine DNA glycosylase AlkC
MPEPFKTFLNESLVRDAARELARTSPTFKATAFVADVIPSLEPLELKARAMLIADALERHLAPDFDTAASHLERTTALRGWFLWSAGEFVARRGLDTPERALACLRELTQRFTAEFAIRPFLVRHPERTFATLHTWLAHESEHVRRLVSEGTRPRLPWGMQLKSLIADPSPSLPLLEALLDDDSAYVRRSVANHLNDIAKYHPALVTAWVERFLPHAPPARVALLRHASRTLIKQGNQRLLTAWGRGTALCGTAALTITPRRMLLGGHVTLTATLTSSSRAPQPLTVDYVVHHVRADGRTSPKVFKGWSARLGAGETVTLEKRHVVKPITTRRYYAGRHRVELQVNGQVVAEAHFTLRIP